MFEILLKVKNVKRIKKRKKNFTSAKRVRQRDAPVQLQLLVNTCTCSYTQGEMTSQILWSRYIHHFVGITWHNVWS